MIERAGEILILTGPPGSGKTTAASVLAQEAGSPKVYLHADDFWHFIKHGALPPYLPQAQAQNRVVIETLARTATSYAAGGYFVILDGIVGPWFLEPFRQIELPLHYVVLRPLLETAIRRCQQRGGDTLTDPEHIAALHRQFASLGPLEHHALPNEGLDPAAICEAIMAAVDGNAFQLDRERQAH